MYDEVMTASRLGFTKSFSALTFAIFKDSGWYKVNDIEPSKILWGYKKGCIFLKYGCTHPTVKFEEFCVIDE